MDTETLAAWTVGTAALVVCVVGAILATHLTGDLGQVIRGTDTATASLLFGYLWLLSIVAASYADLTGGGGLEALGRGAGGGAVAGGLFLTVVLIIGFVTPDPGPVEPGLVPVFHAVAVGTVVGAVVGGAVAALVLACDRLSRAVVAP